MGRSRDNDEYGADASAGTGPVSRHADGTAVGVARHLGFHRRMPIWLKVTSAVLTVLVVGALGFAGYWYFRLQSNITTAPLTAGDSNPDTDSTGRLQILILGSDTREGKNSDYGSTEDSAGYGQSDVMMLMDISEDNQRVSVISFPRDLLVDIPQCTDPETKQVYPERTSMINEAMAEAGIGCAVDTVNKLTGLEVDHFMMADFNAVKELSNTVGGVEVCISDAVYDPDSRLRLPAGTSAVQGEMALAYLRARHAFADGGDLGRIKAQQGFLSSLTRKVKDEGTLSDPGKMLRIADVVTQNLTVDNGLASVPSLLSIANRLKDIDISKVAFVAVPTAPAVSDPNRLEIAEPAGSQLFAALREDVDLTNPTAPATPSPSPSETTAPAPAPTETAPPLPPYDKAIQAVTVANGTGLTGRAEEIVQALIAGGFTQAGQFLAAPVEQSIVYYGTDYADVAADVAALLGIPAGQVQLLPTVAGVQVYLGTDFTSGTTYGAVALPENIVNQTAGDATCQQANPMLIVQG
jgi:LCP family protein required for cell wall assembly